LALSLQTIPGQCVKAVVWYVNPPPDFVKESTLLLVVQDLRQNFAGPLPTTTMFQSFLTGGGKDTDHAL
jgi:hypothetical protein